MACFNFLSSQIVSPWPEELTFFPGAIDAAGTFVYGSADDNVRRYSWPGLVFDSDLYTGVSGLGDVTVDENDNVYYSAAISDLSYGVYKNGTLLATVSITAGNRSGNGLAYSSGYVWICISTDDATDTGYLYKIDVTTGDVTLAHSQTGGRFTARPYAASDGAIWHGGAGGFSGTVFRYVDGVGVATTALNTGHFCPRPDGVMLVWDSTGSDWYDMAPDLTYGTPSCDPTMWAGATGPQVTSFTNPDQTDACVVDAFRDIYRAEAPVVDGRFTVGRIRFPR